MVDVDELERSASATYALSFEGEQLTSTLSLAYTQVENLAALDETEEGVPLLTQLDEKAKVQATDLALGYQFTEAFNLSVTFEVFNYDDNFKTSYTSAPIEERITLGADYDIKGWDLAANLVWFGSRDLSQYGYGDSYNGVDAAGNVIPETAKTVDAPSYYTLDVKATKELSESLSLYVGASNLLDYTQAGDEESPLMYGSAEGAGEYDVAYIYGPLRGREAYLGVKLKF